jgi:chromosome segregation ATPase
MSKSQRKLTETETRIDEIRRRIHELYTSAEGPRAHTEELERLSGELSELMAERPEVVDGTR